MLPTAVFFVKYYLEEILSELLFMLKIQKKNIFLQYRTSASTNQKWFLLVIHKHCIQPCTLILLNEKIRVGNVLNYAH